MILRKAFVLISGIVAIWFVLAGPNERREFLVGLKTTLTPPNMSGWHARAEERDRRSEYSYFDNEESPVLTTEEDSSVRIVSGTTRVFDRSFQPIGSLDAGEQVSLIDSIPEDDIARVRTENGLEGRIPLHLLRKP